MVGLGFAWFVCLAALRALLAPWPDARPVRHPGAGLSASPPAKGRGIRTA
jgi:hypothetical protein